MRNLKKKSSTWLEEEMDRLEGEMEMLEHYNENNTPEYKELNSQLQELASEVARRRKAWM